VPPAINKHFANMGRLTQKAEGSKSHQRSLTKLDCEQELSRTQNPCFGNHIRDKHPDYPIPLNDSHFVFSGPPKRSSRGVIYTG